MEASDSGSELALKLQVARLLRVVRDAQLSELDSAAFRVLVRWGCPPSPFLLLLPCARSHPGRGAGVPRRPSTLPSNAICFCNISSHAQETGALSKEASVALARDVVSFVANPLAHPATQVRASGND